MEYIFISNIFVLLNSFISFIYIKRYVRFDFSNLQLKKYLSPLIIILILINCHSLYGLLDKMVLGNYALNIDEVAYYSLGERIMGVALLVISIMGVVINARMSYSSLNDKNYYQTLTYQLFSFTFLLLFPITIGLMVVSKDLLLLVGDQKYLHQQTLVALFALDGFVGTVLSMLIYKIVFLQSNKEKLLIFIIGTGGILNGIFKLVLVKLSYLTANSAIFTTMLSGIFVFYLVYHYIKNRLKLALPLFRLSYVRYLLIALCFFPISYAVNYFALPFPLGLIMNIGLCALFYFAMLYFMQDEFFLYFVREGVAHLKRRMK